VLVNWIIFLSDTSHPLSKWIIQKKAKAPYKKKPSKTWIVCSFNVTQRSSLESHQIWISNVPRPPINQLYTNTLTFFWRSFVNMRYQLKMCIIWTRRIVREGMGIKTWTKSTLYTGHIGLNIEHIVGILSSLQSLSVFMQMVPAYFQGSSLLGKCKAPKGFYGSTWAKVQVVSVPRSCTRHSSCYWDYTEGASLKPRSP
jgi:hypothetical protein